MSDQTEHITDGFKMTELGPLPEEWELTLLGAVAAVASGGPAPQGDHYFGGGNPFVRVQHVEQGTDRIRAWDLITDQAVRDCGLRLFPRGTIVLPKSGASVYLEKRAVLPIDAYIVSHLCALAPRSEMVDSCFLFHLSRHIRFAELKADGYPTLNIGEIKARMLPLPPFREQKAIARVLSTIQKAIEAQDKVIAAARELKKSLMRHLFTYGPVPVAEAEKVSLKETEIGPVPQHWEVVRLGERCDVKGGKRLPKGHAFADEPTKHPYIRVVDLRNGSVDLSDLKFLTHDDFEMISRYTITASDVYISIAGTTGLIGTIPERLDGANLTENAAKLVIRDTNQVDRDFLKYALSADNRQQQILQLTTKTSQPKLALSRIQQIVVPLPAISEQQQVARILSTVAIKTAVEEKRKASLQTLFRTMLDQLMTGKLRVKDLEVTAE